MPLEAEPYLTEGTSLTGLVTNEAGTGFAVGAIGGFSYYFLKDGLHAARANAGRIGGLGAGLSVLWFGVRNGLDYLRDTTDPVNNFAAAAITGAAAMSTRGFLPAATAALGFGSLVTYLDVRAEYRRKLEERLNYRHTGPPGSLRDELAKLDLTIDLANDLARTHNADSH